MEKKYLKIALIGTRGVPANYGGFETCVEELGKRLVTKGHEVTVYCRDSYYDVKREKYLGMNLVYLPNAQKRTIDTLSHTFFSAWHSLLKNFDIYMVFNAANSLLVVPLRMFNRKIAINTDGLEWRRSKWGYAGKSFYKISEKIACLIANRIVADSKGIKQYYSTKHATDSTEIAYGAYVKSTFRTNIIHEMGLKSDEYFLQITRFEPENHPLLSIQAFNRLGTNKKLVLVGGNPYPTDYTQNIEQEINENILLPGFIYDQEVLEQLWGNCFAYIHGNSVGGTNPALLQTMANGCFTIAIDVQFNRDVLSECGRYYKNNIETLCKNMEWAIENEDLLPSYRKKARQRIIDFYSWDKIADQYENLFYELSKGKYPWKLSVNFFRGGKSE